VQQWTYVDVTGKCPAGSTATGGPLLLYLQHAATSGPTTDATGASNIKNEEFSLFAQDQYQIRPNLTLNYGLRWDAQIFPDPLLAPGATAYGPNLDDPRFPSDGTIHNQTKMFQPRLGFSWDIRGNAKSVLRGSWESTMRDRTC
jgi:outer membrane receptor protein involved in Fe transport